MTFTIIKTKNYKYSFLIDGMEATFNQLIETWIRAKTKNQKIKVYQNGNNENEFYFYYNDESSQVIDNNLRLKVSGAYILNEISNIISIGAQWYNGLGIQKTIVEVSELGNIIKIL